METETKYWRANEFQSCMYIECWTLGVCFLVFGCFVFFLHLKTKQSFCNRLQIASICFWGSNDEKWFKICDQNFQKLLSNQIIIKLKLYSTKVYQVHLSWILPNLRKEGTRAHIWGHSFLIVQHFNHLKTVLKCWSVCKLKRLSINYIQRDWSI